MTRSPRRRRDAFTLIEMLVVVVIIGILAALITAAVSYALNTAGRARNRVEISQIQSAVEAFKAKYNKNIPSRLFLSETGNYTPGGSDPAWLVLLKQDSATYLSAIWPRLGAQVDWNGNGAIDSAAAGGDMVLEGDQCLVFFLGGIPAISGGLPITQGFSTDPTNPANFGAGVQVQKPFYEFLSSRLVNKNLGGAAIHASTAPLMLSYLDTYGTANAGTITTGRPYAYFSSYDSKNGYNRYGTSDCATLGLWPYAQSAGQYYSPTGYQIISAGKDFTFGQGSTGGTANFWIPATAANSTALNAASGPATATPAGADDQGSFAEYSLGTSSQ